MTKHTDICYCMGAWPWGRTPGWQDKGAVEYGPKRRSPMEKPTLALRAHASLGQMIGDGSGWIRKQKRGDGSGWQK